MKKLVSLILAMLMMLSLIPGSSASESKLSEELLTYTALIPEDAHRKVEPKDMALYKDWEAKTNVHLEWTTVPIIALNERKSTIFASGDYPDMFINMLSNTDVINYGMAGALLDLTPYINEEYMPNFTKALKEVPDAVSAITMPDGKIYGLPQINMYSVWPGDGVYIRTSQMINADWLSKLGLAMPQTTDELLEVLRAFKTKDPNGNGIADEIPYSFCYSQGHANGMGDTVFGPFGILGHIGVAGAAVLPVSSLNVQNGKVFYAVEDERYVKAIQFARTLYEEGLMDPEVFTQDKARLTAKGNAETPVYGLVNGWTGEGEVGAARAGVDGTMYQPLPPVTGPDGECIWRNEPAGISVNGLCISSTVKNPDVIIRWADLLYAPDATIQEIWGMEGMTTRKQEDGSWLKLPPAEGNNVEEWIRSTSTRYLPGYLSDDMANHLFDLNANGAVSGKDSVLKCRIAAIYAPYAVKEYYPTLSVLSVEDTEEIALLNTPVMNAMREKEVAWIMGQSKIEDEYTAFLANLRAMGLTRMVEIYQATYDRVSTSK